MANWFIFNLLIASSKVKFRGQRSGHTRYDNLLKWSVRPRVRAL